jgi:hypothetical protein
LKALKFGWEHDDDLQNTKCGDAFVNSVKKTNAKHHFLMNISKEEADKFSESFKNPEFRKLFLDYCNEISNPETRQVFFIKAYFFSFTKKK